MNPRMIHSRHGCASSGCRVAFILEPRSAGGAALGGRDASCRLGGDGGRPYAVSGVISARGRQNPPFGGGCEPGGTGDPDPDVSRSTDQTSGRGASTAMDHKVSTSRRGLAKALV